MIIKYICLAIRIALIESFAGDTNLNEDNVQILAVSTIKDQPMSRLEVLRDGGTLIYLRIQGLDPLQENNVVYIGYDICITKQFDYFTMSISCKNTDMVYENASLYIIVSGKQVSFCTLGTEYCYVKTKESVEGKFTKIDFVSPSANYPNKEIIVKTNIPINNANNEYGIKIGGGYYDIIINNFQQFYEGFSKSTPQQNYYIAKLPPNLHVSSREIYSISEYGKSVNYIFYSITPIIIGLNINQIFGSFTKITIYGYSFGDITKAQVFIGGKENTAVILKQTSQEIEVQLPNLTNLFQQQLNEENKMYLSGSGVFYTLYNISDFPEFSYSVDSFRNSLISQPELFKNKIVFDGVHPTLDCYINVPHKSGQYFRGFLMVPQSGNYKFLLTTSGNATLHISLQNFTVFSNSTPLTRSQNALYRNYWFNNSQNSTSDQIGQISDINLTGGSYYFIEIFNVYEANKEGHITLSVEILIDKIRSQEKMYYVSLLTSYDAVKEIIGLKMYNKNDNLLTNGSYKISFKNTNDSKIYYTTKALSLQCLPEVMKNEIESSTPYLVSITAQKINFENQIMNDDDTEFAGYFYTITFESYRGEEKYRTLPEITQLVLPTEFSYQFEPQIIQQPKGPIHGTFQLNISNEWMQWTEQVYMPNKSIDLPFDIDPQIIESSIRNMFEIECQSWCFGKAQDGRNCYFKSPQYFEFQLNSSLQSESSNVQLTSKFEYSASGDFYEPIETWMVYTYYNKPQVQVSIQNKIIGCEFDKCGIQLNIKTITFSNFILKHDNYFEVNFFPPSDYVMNAYDFSGQLAGGNCLEINISKLNSTHYFLQCEIEKLNGKVIREAGYKQLPAITHKVYGLGIFQINEVGLETELTIDQISPTTGSPNGGTLVTLNGAGFPRDSNSQFQLKQGTKQITPFFISNHQIQFRTNYFDGKETSYNITLTFNNKTTWISFSYKISNSFNITSLENARIPYFSETIKIFGNNLGDSIDDVYIALQQVWQSYSDCCLTAIIASVSPTVVEIQTKYLAATTYKFSFRNNQYGDFQKPNTYIEYNFSINPFSQVYTIDDKPPYISLSGGVLIKIVGFDYVANKYFIQLNKTPKQENCDIDQNLSQKNILFCKIQVGNEGTFNSRTSIIIYTQLQNGTSYSFKIDSVLLFDSTQTPLLQSYPQNLQNQDQPDKEFIFSIPIWTNKVGRSQRSQLLINQQMQYNIDFTIFKQLIIRRRKNYQLGAIETLIGTNILGTVWVKFEGPETLIVEALVQENVINYTIPNLPQGDYKTFIYTANGNVDKKWITEILFNVDNISEIYYGGGRININGTGFNKDYNLLVTLNNIECKNIEVIDYHQIYCDYLQQVVSNTTLIVQQISSTNESVLIYQQILQVQVSNYFLKKISINDQKFSPIQSNFIKTITGTIKIAIGEGFNSDGFLQLSNEFIKPMNNQTNYETIFDELPIGKYQVQARFNNQTAEISVGSLILNVQADSAKGFSIDQKYKSSFRGGRNITISDFGFGEKTKVSICGFQCQIKVISFTKLECEIPEIQSNELLNKYPILQQYAKELTIDDLEIVSDNQYNLIKLFDKKQATYFETIPSSNSSNCSIIFNTKQNQNINLKLLRFSTISNSTLDYSDLKFYIQDIDLNWQLIDLGFQVQQGWNSFNPYSGFPNIKAIKLTDSTQEYKSACKISEISIYGLVQSDSMYNPQSDSITCDVNIFVEDDLITSFKEAVVYSNLVEVTNVSPQYGEISAQEIITITGSGFLINKTVILIDTINCKILTLDANLITCQTGIKDITQVNFSGNFEVQVDGSKALIHEQFIYIQKWSSSQTWGGWTPQNQTSLIIYQNQTVLLDVSYISLNRLIVDGILIFSDELDIYLELDLFIINQGKLVIGTPQNPHQHNVKINVIAFQDSEFRIQLIRKKGLACIFCQIDIHGIEKSPSWALLSKNASQGDQIIETQQSLNWIIGDKLMISSNVIKEIEYLSISSISENGRTITLDRPLSYNHLFFDDQSLEIVVVGRNIQIIGSDPTVDSYSNLNGFNFKIIGSAEQGTKVRISYTQFSKGGKVESDSYFYPIHFYQNYNLGGSYLRGNYFQNNLGPCIAIENAFNLEIQSNVILNNSGHGVYLISGREINNIIIKNLVQGVSPSRYYDQSSTKPASFWISNPQNTVVLNRAVQSLGIGFFFQINQYQFCLNDSHILGFEDNLARQTESFALIVNIIPNNCQNKSIQIQLIQKFDSLNNMNGDLLVLVEMEQQYHKSKFFFNQTQQFGLQVQFSKDFFCTEQSAIILVNYTFKNSLQVRKSSQCQKKLSLIDVPNLKNCSDGDWFNDESTKTMSVCLSKMNDRIFDEVITFVDKISTKNKIQFYGTLGSTYYSEIFYTDNQEDEAGGSEAVKGCAGTGNNNGNGSGAGAGTGTDNGNGSGGDQDSNNNFKWSNSSAWPNKRSPNEDEDVVIGKDQTINLDISPPKLGQITIFGILVAKESPFTKILQAKEINIADSGNMIVGNAETPYNSDLIIKTNSINSANGIQMISNTNLTIWTRLTKFAKSSTNTIQISECQGWKVGDIIVISTSSPDPSENEKKIIISIQDCLITLEDTLQFDHYGASYTTLKKNDIGELDMRTVVLHLNRKIKIQGLDNSCLIKVNGTTILQGVEFENCGSQDDPGISLQQQNDNDNPTQLISCSFHEFNGQMLNVSSSDNLIIKNNVFFKGLYQLIEIKDYNKIKFNNNVLVYVQKSKSKVWAVLGNFIDTKLQEINRTKQDFSQNIGVASEDAGFYILSQSCSLSNSSSFYNLQCSSAVHSCFVIKQFDSNCDYIGQLSASNSQIGIMYSINTEEMRVENIIASENKINLIIKGTTQGQINNQIKFSNSYITALARPECSECYQTISQIQNCQNSLGMQMVTISSHTYSLIQDNFTSNQYDLITSNERLDVRVFITNVIFDNFKLQYESFPLCQFNSVFRQHPQAYDVTGRHYLINSPCINCDFDALLYKFRDSNYSQIGVYGGCGSMECTGMKNSLISDETGEFFGEISQAIGNNSYFGQYKKDSCSYQKEWNGYWCKGLNIQVLNFMSIATDYAKRLFSPVKLLENKNLLNILNSFIEWKWNGTIPMNTRESKFAGTTPKNKSISITVSGVNPTSSLLWLSSNSYNGEKDYQLIQWQFQESLVIQVSVNNEVILPGITTQFMHYNLNQMTDQCGANNYFHQNNTIQIIITNQDFCMVTVSLRNFISVSTTLIVTNSFDLYQFISYIRDQFGGFPQNYYIFSINKFQRRFLAEQESIVEIQWGFVETSEVGTEQAQNSIQKLEDLSERLQYTIFPDDIGTLISQSSTIIQLPYLNYPSSEEQPQKNNTQSDQSQNSNNNNGNSNNNSSTNSTNNNNNEEEEFNPVENESVNIESPSSNNQTVQQTGNQIKKEQNQKDYTLTIVLAVVLPIVGVAIIIWIIFYIRKKKPDRQILYTCTTSAAEITARAHNVNAHSKKLSIATPAVKEENALAPQNNLEQIQ